MKKLFLSGVTFALLGPVAQPVFAQFSLNAQLRTRAELRDGQGTPLPQNSSPAFFLSQRTRLGFTFNSYRLRMGVTVQDVRVWGQDGSTIARNAGTDNNGLMIHEAWAAVMLTDSTLKNKSLQLKIGRQELVYDDSRLLGNLDWLQQGRRHDAAVLRYETPAWQLDVAGAFNQNKENAAGTVYNPTPAAGNTGNTNAGTNYKSLEFVYASRKFKDGHLSFLFLADQFSKFHTDSVDHLPVKVWENATNQRYTTGLFYLQQHGNLTITAAAYYQTGTPGNGTSSNSTLLSIAGWYKFRPSFSAGLGTDYTSPHFDPLYGTPHKFWGSMDYFYAGSPFGSQGLQDYYLRSKWKPATRWDLGADLHQFFSAGSIPGQDKNFGTELDINATCTITGAISMEAGYSHYWNTNALTSATVKNINNPTSNSNWAYVMINIRPQLLIK